MALPLLPRQTETIPPLATSNPNPPDNSDYYYYDGEGETIKYAVVGALAAFFLAWIILGTIHARRRIKKGKRPLLYHRWLAPTYRGASYYHQPHYDPYGMYARDGPAFNGSHRPGDAYVMGNWQQAPPPPAYTAEGPPQYRPPEGASKVDPFQYFTRETTRRAGESSTRSPEPESTTAALQAPEPSHRPNNPR